jgi:hypothetical protein
MHLPPGVGLYFRNILDSPEFGDAELLPQYDLLCDRVFHVLARHSRCRVLLLDRSENPDSTCLWQIAVRVRLCLVPDVFKSVTLLEWYRPVDELEATQIAEAIDAIATHATVDKRIVLVLHEPDALARISDPDFGNLMNRLTVRSRLNFPLSFIGLTTLDRYRQYIEVHPGLERNNQPIYNEAI